MIAVTC